MKWFSISSEARQKTYELRAENEKILTLVYHSDPGTIRISANDEKRVFFVGREGFLRSRTVLRNEYGIRMGQVAQENTQDDNHGTIELSGEEFVYRIQGDGPFDVIITKNGEMIAECELPETSKSISGNGNYDILILTLGWWLSANIKKPVEEFA